MSIKCFLGGLLLSSAAAAIRQYGQYDDLYLPLKRQLEHVIVSILHTCKNAYVIHV